MICFHVRPERIQQSSIRDMKELLKRVPGDFVLIVMFK